MNVAVKHVYFIVLENPGQLEQDRKAERIDQFDVRKIENLVPRLFMPICIDSVTAQVDENHVEATLVQSQDEIVHRGNVALVLRPQQGQINLVFCQKKSPESGSNQPLARAFGFATVARVRDAWVLTGIFLPI
jgi:hypothetical protein